MDEDDEPAKSGLKIARCKGDRIVIRHEGRTYVARQIEPNIIKIAGVVIDLKSKISLWRRFKQLVRQKTHDLMREKA